MFSAIHTVVGAYRSGCITLLRQPPCTLPASPSVSGKCSCLSQTKAELLHKQNAQIKELRRKHEAAQLAVAGAASAADDDGDQDSQGQEKADGSGDETDGEDERGVIAALRKV